MPLDSTIIERWNAAYGHVEFDVQSLGDQDFDVRAVYTRARDGHRPSKKNEACAFCDYDQSLVFSQYKDLHPEHYMIMNIFPLNEYSFVFPSDKHQSMEVSDKNPLSVFAAMRRVAKETGLITFRNSFSGGATQPQHEHFQAFYTTTPYCTLDAEFLEMGVAYFPQHKGANLSFFGSDSCEAAAETVKKFPEYFTAFNTVITQTSVTIFPRKKKLTTAFGKRFFPRDRMFGGNEMVGIFGAKSEEHFASLKNPEEFSRIDRAYREVLHPMDLVETISRL